MSPGKSRKSGLHVLNQVVLNSLRPSDTYMHQYNIPALVQIMAYGLFGAKPLSEPMLIVN